MGLCRQEVQLQAKALTDIEQQGTKNVAVL